MSRPAIDPVAPVEAPAASSPLEGYEQRINALNPTERAAWELSGELPAEAQPQNSDDTSASSPDTSVGSQELESGAAPDPAIEEQPKVGETPEQKSERKKRNDHSRYVREKTRADMLERQLAELKAAPAPAATPAATPAEKPAPKPAAERPKRPRMKDFTGEHAADDFDLAWDKYEADLDKIRQSDLDERFGSARQDIASTTSQSVKYARAREKFTDFDTVAFNPKVPATWAVIHVVDTLDNGPEMRYQIGKDLTFAAKLAEMAFIPGEEKQDAAAFKAWLNASPNNAILFGEKVATVKAELAKIGKVPPKAAPTKQQPPRPTSEVQVEPKGAPMTDAMAAAITAGDYETYEKLANQAELAERTGRR